MCAVRIFDAPDVHEPERTERFCDESREERSLGTSDDRSRFRGNGRGAEALETKLWHLALFMR